jgi:LVIVD repeat
MRADRRATARTALQLMNDSMTASLHAVHTSSRAAARRMLAAAALATIGACAQAPVTTTATPSPAAAASGTDPRVGLKPGMWDAGEAISNLRLVSTTRPPERFLGGINSDLAFKGNYVIQGSFRGYQVWDISNPARPALHKDFFCPASQSDVSVYRNLLFVSGEDLSARLDCGAQGVNESVSKDRLRGIRIFDISDLANPRNVGNVQTCRGSHTHTVLVDPKDTANVYVYISGSGPVRSDAELAGCVDASPDKDPNSALFRIEVIKVPLANPEKAAIVSSPRIFTGLTQPKTHGEAAVDAAVHRRMIDSARRAGGFIAKVQGEEEVAGPNFVRTQLDSIVKARGGTGAPTAADSATLRTNLQRIVDALVGASGGSGAPQPGPSQCHDITVYPAIGLAGGACGGYGLLLDISDPANPKRIGAAADSNFSYWHSATFNNDGTKILFTDEWGGGMAPKCRASDPREWGADAIFTLTNGKMDFKSYYKLPAPQAANENCVAHNGSLVPIPGRDVMVQSWYQGGISMFDFTDPARPREIAYHDRGPTDAMRTDLAGSWSVYWYNGLIVSSEIQRGLDIFELVPSQYISKNEIDAAKTVRFDYLNAQGQTKLVWPPSFALARAYVDQLERSKGLSASRLTAVRQALAGAEAASGAQRSSALASLATQIDGDVAGSSDGAKVRMLGEAVRALAR